jgi:hypothetical protein
MKKLFKLTVVLMALILMGGVASAFNDVDHVKFAPNGEGDLLIYPWYAAFEGGWQTKICVINTSLTQSAVAKLVIRSQKNSEELLDFLLYLTPTDMWCGEILYDAAVGGPVMFSEDDSALVAVNPDVFASEANPINQPLITPSCPDDTNLIGYVNLIEAWTGPVFDGGVLQVPPIDKALLKAEYEAAAFPANTDNILAGHMEWGNPTIGLTSAIRARHYREYDNQIQLNTTNPTFLGEDARNNITEIEAAQSKDAIAMPFVNDQDDLSVHFFTYATKQTVVDADCDFDSTRNSAYSGFDLITGCVPYTLNVYDMEENTVLGGSPFSPAPPDIGRFCDEVNIVISLGLVFEEGWLRYFFGDFTSDFNESGQVLAYTGSPVIPVTMDIGASGLNMAYGHWENGLVRVADVDIPFYQTFDQTATVN